MPEQLLVIDNLPRGTLKWCRRDQPLQRSRRRKDRQLLELNTDASARSGESSIPLDRDEQLLVELGNRYVGFIHTFADLLGEEVES